MPTSLDRTDVPNPAVLIGEKHRHDFLRGTFLWFIADLQELSAPKCPASAGRSRLRIQLVDATHR